MHHNTTSQDPDPCTCPPCTFINILARMVPELPQDLDEMGDALAIALLSPEARDAFKIVLRQFDGMGRRGRKQAVRALAEMDATQRSLAVLLLDFETRDALKSMVRAAERGDV